MKTLIIVIGVIVAMIAMGLLFVYINGNKFENNMDNKQQRAMDLADNKVFEEMKIERTNIAKVDATGSGNQWEIIYDLKTVDPYSRIRAKVNLTTNEVIIEKVEK